MAATPEAFTIHVPDAALHDLQQPVVDRDLNVLIAPFPITTTDDAYNPDVDGDGTNWLVAYSRNGDIHCQSVAYDQGSGLVSVSSSTVVAGTAKVEQYATVAFMGESYLIGYRLLFGGSDYAGYSYFSFDDDVTAAAA